LSNYRDTPSCCPKQLKSIFVILLALALLIPTGIFGGQTIGQKAQYAASAPINSALSSSGFLYETLLLNNQSLVHGNYIRHYTETSPYSILYDHFTGDVYVSYENSFNISVYNGTNFQFLKNVTLPVNTSSLQLDTENGDIMAYSPNSDEMYIIDQNNSVKGSFTGPGLPSFLVVDISDNTIYWVTETGKIDLINATTYESMGTMNLFVVSIVYDPANGNVYVLNLNGTSTNLIVIGGNHMIESNSLNGIGIYMALDQTDNLILVQFSGSIGEYNATTGSRVGSIQVSNYGTFFGVFYCNGNGLVYAVSEGLSQTRAYAINGSFKESINLGLAPSMEEGGEAYDSASHSILIIDTQSDAVSIISLTIYTVNFEESGLESGTEWSVSLASTTEKSINSSIDFVTGNGTYQYSIVTNGDYELTASQGTINVSGNNVYVNIYFKGSVPLYPVRIYSILPAGMEWRMTMGNVTQWQNNTAINGQMFYQFMTFDLPQGSYNYSLYSPGFHVVPPYGTNWTYSYLSPSAYQPNFDALTNLSATGTINVSSSIDCAAFFKITTYGVTFLEKGLPSGTYWYVSLNGGQHLSNNDSNTIYLANGTYDLNIGTSGTSSEPAGPYYGSNGFNASITDVNITVDSSGRTVDVNFSRNLSYVYANFTFVKYPTDYPRAMIMGNLTEYSALDQNLSFLVPKGNHSAKVLSDLIGNIVPRPDTTSLLSSNFAYLNFSAFSNLHENILFDAPSNYYLVTFYSNQSPEGSASVLFFENQAYGEDTLLSPNGTFYEYLKNGTYSVTYSVPVYSNYSYRLDLQYQNIGMIDNQSYFQYSPEWGFSWYPISNYIGYQGNFSVNGKNETVLLNFERNFEVTFNESGLQTGTVWNVTLNGAVKSSVNGSISFDEQNGSYDYLIQSVSGYSTAMYSGVLVVSGNSITMSVIWKEVTYPITISGTGIPSGTSWSATLTGTTFSGQSINVTESTKTSSLLFNEPNGSYSYEVHLPLGHRGRNLNGSITVNGQPITVKTFANSSMDYTLIIVVVLIVVVPVGIVIEVVRRRIKK
jgi:hypothetical protein